MAGLLRIWGLAIVALVAVGAARAAEAPIRFQLPLACAPGTDCWIFNYVDDDPAPEARRDYACGVLTYDAHKGTDFAIRDLAQMARGVPVLAAAPGLVIGARDGMADADYRSLPPDAIKNRECGNGVRIRHSGGWITQYCHMRKGSIRVRTGDEIKAGQSLGLVGMSGRTEFPHMHFQVEHDGRIVDPFRGIGKAPACGAGEGSLWADGLLALLSYHSRLIYNGGFSARKPTRAAARRGRLEQTTLPRDTRTLYLWADIRAPREGDRVVFEIDAPDGRRVGKAEKRMPANKALALTVLTINAERPWRPGRYTANISISDGSGGHRDTLVRHVTFE